MEGQYDYRAAAGDHAEWTLAARGIAVGSPGPLRRLAAAR